jgi:hypothetical protein
LDGWAGKQELLYNCVHCTTMYTAQLSRDAAHQTHTLYYVNYWAPFSARPLQVLCRALSHTSQVCAHFCAHNAHWQSQAHCRRPHLRLLSCQRPQKILVMGPRPAGLHSCHERMFTQCQKKTWHQFFQKNYNYHRCFYKHGFSLVSTHSVCADILEGPLERITNYLQPLVMRASGLGSLQLLLKQQQATSPQKGSSASKSSTQSKGII